MSNLVEQIEQALVDEVGNAMTGYTELNYAYNLEDNKFGDNTNRFGVTVGSLVNAPGITRHSTVDHEFAITLTKGYVETASDDEKIRSSVHELHDKMDEILARLYNKKAGLPGIVLLINLSSMDEPEIIEDNKVVALRMFIIVKYRRSVV